MITFLAIEIIFVCVVAPIDGVYLQLEHVKTCLFWGGAVVWRVEFNSQECSETLTIKFHTPENDPKENRPTRNSIHGEALKLRSHNIHIKSSQRIIVIAFPDSSLSVNDNWVPQIKILYSNAQQLMTITVLE
jgi:hypothetical protein